MNLANIAGRPVLKFIAPSPTGFFGVGLPSCRHPSPAERTAAALAGGGDGLCLAVAPCMNDVQGVAARAHDFMSENRDRRREQLRARLVGAARARIAENGLAGLRARDVTRGADCALGALYTVFRDLDELVLQVNSETLDMLEQAIVEELARETDPIRQLRILARSYMKFALDHRNLWAALFEHRLPDGVETPAWHLDKHMFLIQFISRPLALLNPGMSAEDLRIRALTLFSAVHGIISISLEARFVGIPRGRLESELDDFISLLAAGSATGRR